MRTRTLAFRCIEPESGQDLLLEYCAKTLSPEDRKLFEIHKRACDFCDEKLRQFNEVCRALSKELRLADLEKQIRSKKKPFEGPD